MALDAGDFLRTLQSEAAKDGNTITYGTIEEDGEDATARDVTIINTENGDRIEIDELAIAGVSEFGADGVVFETLEASRITLIGAAEKGTRGKVTIGSLAGEALRFPQMKGSDRPFWPMEMARGTITDLRIMSSGKNVFTLTLPTMTLTGLDHIENRRFGLDMLVTGEASGSYAGENGGEGRFTLGAIEMRDAVCVGVLCQQIGAVDIGPFALTGTDDEAREIAITFDGASGSNIFSPDMTGTAGFTPPTEAMAFSGGPLRLSLNGVKLFEIGEFTMDGAYDAAERVYSGGAAASGIFLNVKALPSEKGKGDGKKRLTELGYDTLTAEYRTDGEWDVDAGILSIGQVRLDAAEAGAIDLAFTLSGYTEEFARKFQALSEAMNEADDTETRQMLSMQMLAAAAGLAVDEVRLKLEDDSLTERIIDMQAEKSGQKPAEMATMLPFMAGAMLAPLNAPQFAAMVTEALTGFFKSPGSLTLTAKPDEPVSVAEMMGIAAGVKAGNVEPAELLERFNVRVVSE